MRVVTVAERNQAKQHLVKKVESYAYYRRMREDKYSNRLETIEYDAYYAPAQSLLDRSDCIGDLVMDEHPKKPFRLGDHRASEIGIGSVVYLLDQFNYSRLFKIFGVAGYAEMRVYPLTIIGKGSSSCSYWIAEDVNGVQIQIRQDNYPQIVLARA